MDLRISRVREKIPLFNKWACEKQLSNAKRIQGLVGDSDQDASEEKPSEEKESPRTLKLLGQQSSC